MGTDINRFVKAQEEAYSGYAQALNEIKALLERCQRTIRMMQK